MARWSGCDLADAVAQEQLTGRQNQLIARDEQGHRALPVIGKNAEGLFPAAAMPGTGPRVVPGGYGSM